MFEKWASMWLTNGINEFDPSGNLNPYLKQLHPTSIQVSRMI